MYGQAVPAGSPFFSPTKENNKVVGGNTALPPKSWKKEGKWGPQFHEPCQSNAPSAGTGKWCSPVAMLICEVSPPLICLPQTQIQHPQHLHDQSPSVMFLAAPEECLLLLMYPDGGRQPAVGLGMLHAPSSLPSAQLARVQREKGGKARHAQWASLQPPPFLISSLGGTRDWPHEAHSWESTCASALQDACHWFGRSGHVFCPAVKGHTPFVKPANYLTTTQSGWSRGARQPHTSAD